MANWSQVTIEFPGITQEKWQAMIDLIGVKPAEGDQCSEWDMEQLGGTAPKDEKWGDWVEEHYGAIVRECVIDNQKRILYCRGRWDAAPDKFCDMLADKLDIIPIDMYWIEECDYETTYYYRVRPEKGRFGKRFEYGSIANICQEISREVPAEWWTVSMLGMHHFIPRHHENVMRWYGCRLDDEGRIRDEINEDNGQCRNDDDIPCEICGKRTEKWLGYRYYPEERRLKEYGPALYCGWCDHYKLLTAAGQTMQSEDQTTQEQDAKHSKLFFCPMQLSPTNRIEIEEGGGICITM